MSIVTSSTRDGTSGAAPPISVIVPCRNVADTVAAALDSIRQQTLADFECLLWDDGSEDATPERLAELVSVDRRFRIVGSDRIGLVPALQHLAAAARGHYLARMDADDVSEPGRFARQMALIEGSDNVGLCGCVHTTIGEMIGSGRRRYDNWMNALTDHESIARDAFVECPIAHPTFFMPREVFESVGGYQDHGWPEDYDLFMRILCADYRVEKVADPLFRWREYSARTSLNDARYAEHEFRALKRHYLEEVVTASGRRFFQWGAGEVGKRWLREWGSYRPEAVVDVDPKKIGQEIHGFAVINPEDLPVPGTCFVVVAVGAPGARSVIRDWFSEGAYVETDDYRFIA